MSIPAPIVNKEHGAWAMYLTPMAVGIVIGNVVTWNHLLLLIVATAFFLLSVPVRELALRKGTADTVRTASWWIAVYGTIGIMFTIPLLTQGHWGVLPIGLCAAVSILAILLIPRTKRTSRLSNVLAVSGLSSTGPASYYLSTGLIDRAACIVWLLSVVFFLLTTMIVYRSIHQRTREKRTYEWDRPQIVLGDSLTVTMVIVTFITIVVLWSVQSVAVLFAFVPVGVDLLCSVSQFFPSTTLKRTGIRLAVHSVLFPFLVLFFGHR